ncbi:MAG: rhamnulokinase family protein, partial [Candidatus Aminicenantes bacterium]
PALLEEVKAAMRDAAALFPRGLAGMGVDTWGVDFGLLGHDGSLVGLPFCYRDRRNLGAMEEFFKLVPPPVLYEATGVQFMPFNTLFQIYAMVRERSPELDAAADLLFMPDLFNFLLTGRKAAEATIASTSQMLDPRSRSWIPGLFQAMGLSKRLLQPVIEPGTMLGPLSAGMAVETGLSGVPVIATASHDTAAAVAAVPAEGDRWAYVSSGTWSLVGTEESAPIMTPEALEFNFTNEGGVGGTTRFLKNVTGLWLAQGCRRAWEKDGPVSYEELARAAAEAPSFQTIIDPDSPDFLNPPDMPEAIRGFCRNTGQLPPGSRAAMVRSILESLALKCRLIIDRLRVIRGRAVEAVHIIGGGSRNDLLCRFTAEATGLRVLAGPAEATAVGNILVQAMALGLVTSPSGIRDIVRGSFAIRCYEPAGTPGWEDAYGRSLEILGALDRTERGAI